MTELITICAIDRAAADAELQRSKLARPGRSTRILRRGSFGIARLSCFPDVNLVGVDGFAEVPGGLVYCIVVEFT